MSKRRKVKGYDPLLENGLGITYRNINNAAYKSITVRVPAIVKQMFDLACAKGNITRNTVAMDYIERVIREQLGAAEYGAMMDYVNQYYPTAKTPEVKEYWRNKITGKG